MPGFGFVNHDVLGELNKCKEAKENVFTDNIIIID